MKTRCPHCGECPFPNNVCEERLSRGRRFFLMGALAVPLACKIESFAPKIVEPKLVELPQSSITIDGMKWLYPMILAAAGSAVVYGAFYQKFEATP